jgi:hypothetical protein
MAYLYSYAGAPWKTQERAHEILTTLYKTGRDGLCGNEDCGQMSAWYVLSAMGFYPVCPGRDEYVIGTPILEKAAIDLEGGLAFAVVARGLSPKNKYIQAAFLDGAPYDKSYLRHSDIARGGELVLEMGDRPNPAWGSGKNDRPSSVMREQFVMNPFFVSPSRSFCDSMEVEIRCHTPGAEIRYTTDGTGPTAESPRYTGPLTLQVNTTLKAIAVREGMQRSSVESVEYIRMPYRRTVVYDHPYHRAYTAGGENGLVDGIRGDTASFAEWQGFLGVDLAATVDLGDSRRIRRISTGFLQDYWSWIFLPRTVEYFVSDDGVNFRSIGTVANPVPPDRADSFVREFEKRTRSGKARYVRIVAKNIGVNPPGHPGAGQAAFIFADEIVIE